MRHALWTLLAAVGAAGAGLWAWTGTNHASEQLNRTIRLYLGVWENPHPEKPIAHLDFVVANDGPCAPFCMAITVEEPVEVP